ncbi:MAG: hypothetical protein K0U98_11440 [Deltaproteobacteria bacterium]|nr:hypothetical protein [Deltaproteobacteria bacterium]
MIERNERAFLTCGDLATITNSFHHPRFQGAENSCSCCDPEGYEDPQSCELLTLIVVHDLLPAALLCCGCWDQLMADDCQGLVEELQAAEALAWCEVGEERVKRELGGDWKYVQVEDLRDLYRERVAS